jgi:hypothetical protein
VEGGCEASDVGVSGSRRLDGPWRASAERIAGQDPLDAAPWVVRLPELNHRADVAGLLTALRAILPPVERAAQWDPYAAAAAIRDLGMLLASLRRHGVEPVEALPAVEAVMLQLGERTDMVPRETVLHYTTWNPAGELQRRFTRDASEAGLIEAVRMAVPRVEATVELLTLAYALPPDGDEFVGACEAAARQLEPLGEVMRFVRARVDPTFFATRLRPYFESIRVGGRRYSGAAAAPLGVGLIDHLLWSSDGADPRLREFQAHLMAYGLPGGRRLYAETLGRPSLVTRLVAARGRGDAPALAAGVRALDRLLAFLLAFRSRHTVVAKSAYDEKIRLYSVGSAGYGVDTLLALLQQTKGARQRLHAGG